MESIRSLRKFLRNDNWEKQQIVPSDQRRGVPPPPMEKPFPPDALLIDLTAPEALTVGRMPVIEAIRQRRSRRQFTAEPLTLEELSFLLWATQGITEVVNEAAALRTVPSAGARHPFETYLIVNRVEGIAPGLYRYLPLEHKLCFLRADPELPQKVTAGCYGQSFVGRGAVVFVWTAIPYRTEWRYTIVSHKVIALDAGHLCQNLYLASESIGAGTCAIGAYNQALMDALLGVDGEDEFTIYVAPVGKVGYRKGQ